MSGLSDIAVRVEQGGGAPSAQVLAIANEIVRHLQVLRDSGAGASIDLRSLPLGPGDYQALKALLGEGEVSARIEALGPSEIRETAIPGVWWLVHRNASDEVMADLIEISPCPAILRTQDEELRDGPDRLRARLKEAAIEQHG
jgi:hydrogenase-1 operon protein HyaF